MKKIIYGNSNFRKIKINNDYLYIDKTNFIEKLEKANEIGGSGQKYTVS